MNQEEELLCKYIFERIKQNKLSSIFWDAMDQSTSPSNLHPITLAQIEYKLTKKVFKNPVMFAKNIRLFTDNAISLSPPGTLRYSAALQLKIDVEELLASIESPFYGLACSITASCDKFKEEACTPIKNIKTKETTSQKVGTLYFEEKSSPYKGYDKLIRDIRICSTTGLATRVAAYIKKIQPDLVVVGQNLYLMTKNLSEENLVKLQNYVTRLLKDVAAGKIDPYNRPFGQIIQPVSVQVRK